MPATRFAPSPTGRLHLGHAFSALYAYEAAQDGAFLLRIEDIDPVRCRPEFIAGIEEDLRWLGLSWPQPVRRQSEHLDNYRAAMERLRDMDVVYPCFCTRREVAVEVQNAAQAPHEGPDGPVYPGTCRALTESVRAERLAQEEANWRLDSAKVLARTGALHWHDRKRGKIEARLDDFGDVVIARKDVPTSYHLSVTVDDHLQGITLVTRGEDLLRSTDIHRYLQALLGYATPEYEHHALLKNAEGKRFAKRDKAETLQAMREAGQTAGEIRARIAALRMP
ncbi:MAG: tRNA glutamyl-Q(34) synthetase GluQRS [Bdellovibrionales bacterium]